MSIAGANAANVLIRQAGDPDGIVDVVNSMAEYGKVNRATVIMACVYLLAAALVDIDGDEEAAYIRAGIAVLIDAHVEALEMAKKEMVRE